METINKAIGMMMKKFKTEYGKDERLEDGDELVGVCNDGVMVLSLEDGSLKIRIHAGKPYFLDLDLGLLEKEEADEEDV